MMKKLLALSLVLLSYPAISLAGPKAEIPVKHWNFGKVPQNSTLSHEYWIKNVGDSTLKIISVKPG